MMLNYSVKHSLIIFYKIIHQTRIEELELLRRWNESKEEDSGSYGAASSALGVPDEKPNIVAFPDFVADYFEARYHLVALRMEWTYNIMEACKQLGGIDPRLVQFQHMLQVKSSTKNFAIILNFFLINAALILHYRAKKTRRSITYSDLKWVSFVMH